MNTQGDHISLSQLNEYLDGAVAGRERRSIESHLAACESCRLLCGPATQIDHLLRSLPLERPGSDFTRIVVEQLHLEPKSPLLFRLFENFANFFALMIVATIMTGVLTGAGVIDWGLAADAQGTASKTLSVATEWIDSAANGFAHVLTTYLPFLFRKGAFGIAAAALVVVAALVLVDRFVVKKEWQRAR